MNDFLCSHELTWNAWMFWAALWYAIGIVVGSFMCILACRKRGRDMFHHRKKKSENWRCPICERKFYLPTCPHSLQDVARYEKMNEKWVPTGELRVLVGEPGEYRVLQQMMENKSGEVRWMNVTEISREEEMLDTKKGEVPEFCVSLSDGKYMYRRFRGKQDCLRYGKPWREMTGDNLVYFMGLEIEELQGRLRQLQNELLEVRRPTKACY